MNWLAHLRLAPDEPLVRLGNLAGDFVRGVDLQTLDPRVRRGIDQHRAIDRFVDGHEVHRRSRARFGEAWRRFAGVALDVFYDHFLARDWAQYGDGATLESLAAYESFGRPVVSERKERDFFSQISWDSLGPSSSDNLAGLYYPTASLLTEMPDEACKIVADCVE